MATRAMFEDLVYDELEKPVDVAYVGGEAFYVIDDAGFRRHIDAEQVDREILDMFLGQLEGNQDLAVAQALQMMGKDDLFTKAAVDAQLRNVDADAILAQGIPPQARDMLGMMGFRIIINYRGELVNIDPPQLPEGWGE
ncbi:MAG: hypothetical protein M9928_19970 [Anaerolineae bacterium]|nr:hypothetical protein [Anaerolineae bacterium]MCO5189701.1 hypothetical protein [Anaerolineae bacterium]MCO5192730.1 hypothetical protein [Anaerolineae bacterium]MCO5199824.1 hypothetical protein [Anaerolineae bacterium]MCO5207292.1 hypothetical protein [Anaerolineae bacterium]